MRQGKVPTQGIVRQGKVPTQGIVRQGKATQGKASQAIVPTY